MKLAPNPHYSGGS